MNARAAAGAILETPWVFGALNWLIDPNRIAPVRRILARVPHASLLDLGCGTGVLCGMTGAAYTGVDRSAAYIEYARRHHGGPGRRFEVGDALALDAALGHHDVVALISVLHHFSDDEVRRCLAGLAAVSPHRLFFVDVATERAGGVFHRVLAPLDRGRHFRNTAVWRAMLEAAGWRIEWEDRCATVIGFFPYVVLVAKAPGS